MTVQPQALWVVVILCGATSLAQTKPQLSGDPLTAEQMAVYRTFLATYSNGSGSKINLGNQTIEFRPSDMDLRGCLAGMDFAVPDPSAVHSLTKEILPGSAFQLVDAKKQEKQVKQNDPGTLIRKGVPVDAAVRQGFAAGLLSLSEIAFSRDHHFAALQYSFYCGSLCGHGALVIYENVDGAWKEAKAKRCSFWQS
jgi:hypothetical protein